MNCEEYRELFVEYHLGELDPIQVEQIDRHLATGCPSCRAQMADVLDGIELILAAAPSSHLSEPLRDRLVGLATNRTQPNKAPELTRSRLSSLREGFITGCTWLGSLAAGLILMMNMVPRPVQSVDPIASEPRTQLTNANSDSIGVVPPSILHSRHTSERTQFVSFRQPILPSDFHATLIWDPVGRELHFYGYQFPHANEDRRYVLWVEGQVSTALTSKNLEIDFEGNSFVSIPVPFDNPTRVHVTLEEQGSNPEKPSDQLQLLKK